MLKKWKQFYKQNRLKRLYLFLFPSAREKFLKELRAAHMQVIEHYLHPLLFLRNTEMSNMINIKGKEISEDTIVELLKKHFGAAFFEPLKAGDVVNDPHGEIRIIVENGKGGLRAFDSCGKDQHSDAGHFINGLWDGYYTRIGTLTDFFDRYCIE